MNSTLAETTTNVRLLSESQTRTDQAINRLTDAFSTMTQHSVRLDHLDAETGRFREQFVQLREGIQSLHESINKTMSMAKSNLERSQNHGMTLRQIIPWGTAIIMAAAAVGTLLQD